MSKSKIEWTQRTWNPVVGCSKVSEGCRNCYAMSMSTRIANAAHARMKDGKELTDVEKAYLGIVKWEKVGPEDSDIKALPKWNNNIGLIEERLEQPMKWRDPSVVFVNSMSDLFHPDVPFEFVDKVFAVIALASQHTFQILTKRPERMGEYLNDSGVDVRIIREVDRLDPDGIDERGWITCLLTNVWLGTSVEDQAAADERIPHLLRCPASVRFLSCEPLLGPVDIENYITSLDIERAGLMHDPMAASLLQQAMDDGRAGAPTPLDWVIVGGESGPDARPMHPDWARGLRDQCLEADVPFFFKQWGAWLPFTQREEGQIRDSVSYEPNDFAWKVGKKKAGRLLDGRQWNQRPEG